MSQVRFRPVYGNDETILGLKYQEGCIYFATDTGKIYLDADGKNKKLMSSAGGAYGVTLLYGHDENPIPLEDKPDNTAFTLRLLSIEDYDIIAKDYLILNTDGCFYKVLSIDKVNATVTCTRLSVSGGGGGSSTEADIFLAWDDRTINMGSTYIYDKDSYAIFTPTVSTIDTKVNLLFEIYHADATLYKSIPVNNQEVGEPYSFNTKEFPLEKDFSLKVTVQAPNSQMPEQKRTYSITNLNTVEMNIEKVPFQQVPIVLSNSVTGQLTLHYIPVGDANSGIDEYLHVYFGEEENEDYELIQKIPTSWYGESVPLVINKRDHGTHIIRLALSANINGKDIYTDKIEYQGAWVEAENETPIVLIGDYDPLVINYENSYIQYAVYDPAAFKANAPATVQIQKDSKTVAEMSFIFSEKEWSILDISDLYEVGTNTFSIICRSEKKDITVEVTTEGSRDLGLAQEASLVLNYTAAGRSNQEIKSTRGLWTAKKASTGYDGNAILTGFNWQNNGWRNDGADKNGIDNGSYLAIANGAQVSIPMPVSTLNSGKNYTIEARLRVRNVQKYSTLITVEPAYYYIVPGSITEENPLGTKSEIGLPMKQIEENEYTLYRDGDGNTVTDNQNSKKIAETEDGVICKWMNDGNIGFCIGSQEAYFQTASGTINVRYKEDEVLNISFVVNALEKMIYVYLNGILSGANKLPSDYFIINSPFVFNSDYCDIDLYRFRVYESGLSMPDIIHNYLSDNHSIVLYDQNQLTDSLTPTLLSYDLLVKYNEAHPDEPTMPYAVWKIVNGLDRQEKLPYFKGDKQKVQVTFVNPALDYALDEGLIDEWYYYTHCPSFTAIGAQIDVQGTSSQGYPRRNYKIKYKSAEDTWVYTKGSLKDQPLTEKHEVIDKDGKVHILAKKYHMDNEDLGTRDFTWKIDYMESSGSYNTGFANMMGNKKQPLYTKHPLEDLKLDENTDAFRTTVYGFPVLVFHEYEQASNNPSNAKHTYEYIGRYNMNLDKGSNEYYGYELEEEHPFLPIGTYKGEDDDGNKIDVQRRPLIAEVAECWELADNQGTWCSWRYPNAEAREQGFATTAANSDKLEVMNHFEYRYSQYEDQLDAIIDNIITDTDINEEIGSTDQERSYWARNVYRNLEELFNWLDSTDTDNPSMQDFGSEGKVLFTRKDYSVYTYISVPVEEVYDETKKYFILNDAGEYVLFTKINYGTDEETNEEKWESDASFLERFEMYKADGEIFTREIDETADAVSTPQTGGYSTKFKKDDANYRIEKFRNEFNDHLDLEYCLVYFIMTELLLCYDSRGKNMMMASFGPTRLPKDGEDHAPYVWYPVFYDIDTQLGINNSGAALWDYDADVTEDQLFSTATSVLWNNLYSAFNEEIQSKYRILRGADDKSEVVGKLTYEAINGAYACDPNVFDSYAMKGIRPIIAIGLDEYYKYFATTTIGYFDTNGKLVIESEPAYAYACQGDKKLTIELLLRNRLNYIDSWWQGGDYYWSRVKSGQLMLRVSGNNSKTSDKFLDKEALTSSDIAGGFEKATYPVPYYDAQPGYKLKPFLKQYVTYFNDELPSTPVKYEATPEQKNGVWTSTDDNIRDGFKSQSNTPAQQLNYLPGVDYLSSLGDLSTSYINEFQLTAGKRLLDLTLGSDAPDYYNDLMSADDKFDLNAAALTIKGDPNPNVKSLLKKVLFNNIRTLDRAIDISGSEKMQEFRALNTQILYAIFASGAPLHTVHLPDSITTLTLVEHQDLDRILTETPVVMEKGENGEIITKDPDTYRGLYIKNVTDYDSSTMKNNGHKINRIDIQGGGLGYDSYTILNNLYELKSGATTLKDLAINYTDVNWTPYVLVEYGEVPRDDETYYRLTDHSTYERYTVSSLDEFNNYTLNEQLFTYNNNQDKTVITSLQLLDNFIEQYKIAEQAGIPSQFSNTNGDTKATVPTITGEMFVANANGEAIVEDKLTSEYKKYFPSLNITAENIQEANITKYVKVLESGKEEVVEILRTNGIHPLAPTGQIPAQTNYDFKGWSKTKGGEIFIEYKLNSDTGEYEYTNMDAALQSYTFTTTGEILTLYAVFEIHEWVITLADENGTPYNEIGSTLKVPAATFIGNPSYIPIKIDDDLDLDKVYNFEGWSAVKDGSVVDMTKQRANKDTTYYAVFSKAVSVYDNILDEKYLVFTSGTFTKPGTSTQVTGYYVGINPNYNLSGKITLPLTYNKSPVIGIAKQGFLKTVAGKTNKITHVFWEKGGVGGSVYHINSEGFAFGGDTSQSYRRENSTLVHFEFPSTVLKIDERAFFGQAKLQVNELPEDLILISDYAFQFCENLKLERIGGKVTTIGGFAFNSAMGKKPTLIIGDSVTSIGQAAFASYWERGTSDSEGPWTTVVIGSGIQEIGEDAFRAQSRTSEDYSTINSFTINAPNAYPLNANEPWGLADWVSVSWPDE